jgi:hypothetical protein
MRLAASNFLRKGASASTSMILIKLDGATHHALLFMAFLSALHKSEALSIML